VSARSQLLPPLAWAALADGRVHRLKLGKHFHGDVRLLADEAAGAAERLDKAVRTLRDELGRRNHYLWVQFADAEVVAGDPCVCGSLELGRTHEHFGVCPACRRTVVLVDGAAAPGSTRGRRGHLSGFSDVELFPDPERSTEDNERWYGRGMDPSGWPVVLQVDYPLEHGERIVDPLDPEGHVHRVRRWIIGPFFRAAQLGALDDWPPAEAWGWRKQD